MARKLGSAASINRNTGNYASPAWSFIRTAMDVKLDLQPAGVFDSSDRGVAIDTVIPTARMKAKDEFDAIWSDGDGVGDLLEVGGIETSRHKLNPIVMYDHAKAVVLPIATSQDPQSGDYGVHIDVNDKRAFPYNEEGEYPEQEHIGIEIGDVLRDLAWANYYTQADLLKQARAKRPSAKRSGRPKADQ